MSIGPPATQAGSLNLLHALHVATARRGGTGVLTRTGAPYWGSNQRT
jgi:hypothetical protein